MANIPKKYLYLILAIVFLTLSTLGIINLLNQSKQTYSPLTPTSLPTPTISEFEAETEPETETPPSELQPTSLPDSPPAPSDTPTPTPTIQNFTGPGFSLSYPSYRKLTEEEEASGWRYVFYSSRGNITLHAGTQWSWQHPGRTLTSGYTIADQPTFRYEIPTQTLIDFQQLDKYYTIQCVHQGVGELKQECLDFAASFRFTN
ncbi:hypothetical protein A3K55_02550 [Candidatus Shapirobacteria bacterium RBG_13_44_7]|uniref:Uncharacterized protein n=1 Tax=Candidatus Shapirobacteria bacterium RBG_13_44_7 TaxID=1802149 RepID=A0A1F7SLK8_9BACT|nr:MAG: hypothetical protein A3K55_02550 [Candidatus Shapirobacteria bacterium RBG_13_44_7]